MHQVPLLSLLTAMSVNVIVLHVVYCTALYTKCIDRAPQSSRAEIIVPGPANAAAALHAGRELCTILHAFSGSPRRPVFLSNCSEIVRSCPHGRCFWIRDPRRHKLFQEHALSHAAPFVPLHWAASCIAPASMWWMHAASDPCTKGVFEEADPNPYARAAQYARYAPQARQRQGVGAPIHNSL